MDYSRFRIEPFDAGTRDQYIDLIKFAFHMPESGRQRYFTEASDFPHSLGAWDGDHLACGMWYWAYEMRVRDVLVPMAGVAAVATYPEYRNLGLVRHLIGRLQEIMRTEGRPVSVLAPFKWSYYQDLGWAHTFDVLRLKFEPPKVGRFPSSSCTVREVDGPAEWQSFEMLSSRYGQRYNGPVCRDEQYWRRRYLEHPDVPCKAYLVERDHEPCGFIIGRFAQAEGESEPSHYRVTQAVWTDGETQQAIFRFLHGFREHAKFIRMDVPPDTQIVDLFADPMFEAKLEPKMMTKVIDIKGALERVVYDSDLNESVLIEVDADVTAPWTGGAWRLDWAGGGVSVESTNTAKGAARVSIQTLSQMYMGYRSVEDLVDAGTLQATPEQVAVLSRAFPRYATYIDDWF